MAIERWHVLAAATAIWAASVAAPPDIAAVSPPEGRDYAQETSRDVPAHQGVEFATSDNCLACHNGLIAANGEDVSIGVAWRASMMANSSRDPYWRASVRRETLDHPSHADAIQDECAICHMPMARTAAHAAGGRGRVFALAPADSTALPAAQRNSEEHRLAADGVSCTLCHQIGPENLGTRASFVGGFTLRPRTANGLTMFGPYEVERGLARTMHSATDARPEKADHLRQSETCATCHTLYTNAFGPSGEVIGSLPEQMPYLEWRYSVFAQERTCQSCHMPDVESAPIASVLGEPRERLAKHTFLGGNFFMLRMLNRYRSTLGVTAPAAELEAAAQATIRQLEADTATVTISRAGLVGNQIEADVDVRNHAGHKLPTGYPSRRVWVHLSVRDAAGAIVFESGAVDAAGQIAGNDNDSDRSRFEPHYDEVRSGDQVQIYEAVMAGRDGVPTTGLLTATQYVKDNRLLPRGFDKAKADADIAVRGAATEDASFTDAGDRIRYRIPMKGAGPFAIEAELRYQPISFRWADNLRGYNAPEPRRFVTFYTSMSSASSTVLSRATVTAR